ncbi:putative ABC transport system permease protein [Paenibacillus taihuensis]|uniref:Putative ABC transport system permease protein n=1 Tax=Paenibacillus taihuensis TaxID=1156355 RepID=A0A3D9QX25_9BACL|nr:ABC transporter permease [Paenibacillus taihuensis]REE70478.1 putative ABC transport system permease protein [Paenibacillus taihuensis]
MNLSQAFKMAGKSILANKMRSLLTMLGIIIGVAAVIALVGVGQGTTKQVTDQVESLGTNLLTVNITGRGSKTTVDYKEAEEITNKDDIAFAAPINQQNASVKNGSESTSVSVVGTTADYLDVKEYELAQGRFVAQIDLDYYQRIAVLGATTATDLFGTTNAVGQSFLINGVRYKVVGVLASKGSSLTGSNDEVVVIPITTSERLFKSKGVKTINVQVADADKMDQVVTELETELSKKFRGDTNSYRVFNQQDLLDSFSSISDTLSLALGGVAAISLLVGGIGIMNIMLVSVTERTREIGIRKAIGAKKKDIMIQFLIESIALSGLGGLLGIAIGIGTSQILSHAMKITVVLSIPVIGLAFGFSVFIGVVFGLFPANKASNLRPIEALRFE